MSKVGQKALIVPSSVTVTCTDNVVEVKGKEGVLHITLPYGISLEKGENAQELTVKRGNDTKESKSLHGTHRTLINNAIVGVEKPWEKRLEVAGTGFNVKMQGQDLVFKIGYSHPVVFKKVEGIVLAVDGNTKVIVRGVDKQLVGETAHKIKMLRKPDAYKGKGIKYEGEKLRIKPGKKAKAA
jgi:large subunit ribosomal protein L6